MLQPRKADSQYPDVSFCHIFCPLELGQTTTRISVTSKPPWQPDRGLSMVTSGCLGAHAPAAWQCGHVRQPARAHRRCRAHFLVSCRLPMSAAIRTSASICVRFRFVDVHSVYFAGCTFSLSRFTSMDSTPYPLNVQMPNDDSAVHCCNARR